jgi:hypothetical protein
MAALEINIEELQNVLRHIIKTNVYLQSVNRMPIALNIEGDSGLGKTSVIQQIGQEFGFKPENVVKLSLASFEEIGDLVGMPCEEYLMINQSEDGITEEWVRERAIASYEQKGYSITSNSRMNYSIPPWIANKKGPGILILDDFNRAGPRFAQATMELILTQEYASWKLPKGWTILLSSNPDEDGLYNVAEQDPAQKTRYLTVHLKWDAEIWAKWAEKAGIDGRCINFILTNPEIVSKDAPLVNARSITMLFDSISTLKNFGEASSLELIKLLGEGSLGDVFSSLFVMFIHNKMDKLIPIERIMDTIIPFSDIEEELKAVVKSGNNYRSDIAYTLTTRLLNYSLVNYSDTAPKDIVVRMGEIIKSESLGSDLKFVLGKKVTALPPFTILLAEGKIMDSIIM